MLDKWDKRMIQLAKLVATWSKDPNTKVGAVIFDCSNKVVSVGFNGFPRYIADTEDRLNDRDLKNTLMVHAESNAIRNAASTGHFFGLACTFHPCTTCALEIIQSGIMQIFCPAPERETQKRAAELFNEANVLVIHYTEEEL